MVLSGLDVFDTCYNDISASFTGSALFVLAAVGIRYPFRYAAFRKPLFAELRGGHYR